MISIDVRLSFLLSVRFASTYFHIALNEETLTTFAVQLYVSFEKCIVHVSAVIFMEICDPVGSKGQVNVIIS